MLEHAKHGHSAICDDELKPDLWIPAGNAYLLFIDESLPANFCSKCLRKLQHGWKPPEGPEFIDP